MKSFRFNSAAYRHWNNYCFLRPSLFQFRVDIMSIAAATSSTFGLIDILTLLVYVVAVGVIAFCTGSPASSSSSPGNNTSVSSYFGANRSIAWWAVALSLFSSNVGAEHFIGLAGWGCSGGTTSSSYLFVRFPPFIIISLSPVKHINAIVVIDTQ